MNKEEKEKKVTVEEYTQDDTGFHSWCNDLEEKEQPESCSVDNPDCENCGS